MLEIWFAGWTIGVIVIAYFIRSYKPEDRGKILIATAVLAGVANMGAGFGAYPIAHSTVKAHAVGGYHQTLNGTYVDYKMDTFNCTEGETGSNCWHTFGCDTWTDIETETTYDSKGNAHTTTKLVDKDSICPIATQEFTFTLYYTTNGGKSVKPKVIAEHVFAANPVKHRGRDGTTGSFPSYVARGIPGLYQKVHDGILAGNAPGMTVKDIYDNVILGSDTKAYEAHSFDIGPLKTAGLLPLYTENLMSSEDGITDQLTANKVLFAGMQEPANKAVWEDDLMGLNADLGTNNEGDLHIVAVRASAIPSGISPDRYLNGEKAYLQSPEIGKYALPKNAILLVFGVSDDGSTIEWARAETGMPQGTGNSTMLNLLMHRFQGKHIAFDPDVVLGKTKATIKDGRTPSYQLSSAIVPQIILSEEPFVRACMKCSDPKEKGKHSYIHLEDLIPLSGWAIFLTILCQLLVAAFITALAMLILGGTRHITPSFWGSDSSDNYDHQPAYRRIKIRY